MISVKIYLKYDYCIQNVSHYQDFSPVISALLQMLKSLTNSRSSCLHISWEMYSESKKKY